VPARCAAWRAPDARPRRPISVTPVAAILILLLLAAVILVIAAPLRGGGAGEAGSIDADAQPRADMPRGRAAGPGAGLVRDQLEAAREAKYREIRDSELDYRTGKLSPEDYAAIDTQLRAEALDILDRLEQLEEHMGEDPGPPRTGAPEAPRAPHT
jgi:hypothetical protein